MYAVTGEPFPFEGWISITINLPGNEDANLPISAPFLISRLNMERPLLGFNVLEQLIEGQPEQLAPTMAKLLCDAISVSSEKAKTIVSYIQTTRLTMQHGRLRTGATDMVISSGQVVWVRCRVLPTISTSDN